MWSLSSVLMSVVHFNNISTVYSMPLTRFLSDHQRKYASSTSSVLSCATGTCTHAIG